MNDPKADNADSNEYEELDPTDPRYWQADAAELAAQFNPTEFSGNPPKLYNSRFTCYLLALISSGLAPSTALNRLGVSHPNLAHWRDQAKANNPPYVTFFTLLEIAIAAGEAALWSRVVEAGKDPKFWTAAAWSLERRWPERYALKRDLLPPPSSPQVQINVLNLTPQDLATLMQLGSNPQALPEPAIDGEYTETPGEPDASE